MGMVTEVALVFLECMSLRSTVSFGFDSGKVGVAVLGDGFTPVVLKFL